MFPKTEKKRKKKEEEDLREKSDSGDQRLMT